MPLVFFGNMQKQVLKAKKRKILGRKVKNLRKEGILPANVYGKGVKSLAIEVLAADFKKTFKEAGETSLIELQIAKQKKPVLINNVHKDPVTNLPLHIDFHQVNLKEEVTVGVQIELVGDSPAEKQGLGTIVQYLDEVEVKALPANLPEKFQLDISGLDEVEKALHVKDLSVGKKVKVDADPEEVVVKVEPLRKEEEVAPPTEEAVEGEEAKEGEAGEDEGEKVKEAGAKTEDEMSDEDKSGQKAKEKGKTSGEKK